MNRRQLFGSAVASVAAMGAGIAGRRTPGAAAAVAELEAFDISPFVSVTAVDDGFVLDDDVRLFDAAMVPAVGRVHTMTVKVSVDTAELEAALAALDERLARFDSI